MIDRIKNIILKPREEWPRIDAEPMTEKGIMTGWVLPLAAIGPVAGLIGQQAFGVSGFGVSFKPTLGFSLANAVLGYAMSVFGVWIVAKIIDSLAPSFDGVKNPVAAMKVTAYSWTASFLAAGFAIIPQLGWLALLGLYSLYLLYLGLPVLMKAPAEKAVGYTVVSAICAIVVFVVVGIVCGALIGIFMPQPDMGSMTINYR